MARITIKRHRRKDPTYLYTFWDIQIRLRFRALTALGCSTKRHKEMIKAESIAGRRHKSEDPTHIGTFWIIQICFMFRALAVLRCTTN